VADSAARVARERRSASTSCRGDVKTILPLIWQPSLQAVQAVPFGTGPTTFSVFFVTEEPGQRLAVGHRAARADPYSQQRHAGVQRLGRRCHRCAGEKCRSLLARWPTMCGRSTAPRGPSARAQYQLLRAAHPKATRSAYGHSLLFRAQTSSFTRLKTAPKSRHSFVEVQRCRRFAVCSGFEIARMLEIGNERGLGRAPSEPQ
jgi:hypothetical protein